MTVAPLIQLTDTVYEYTDRVAQPIRALAGVSLELAAGDHVAIVGANGSGKSTLVRHLNGLLIPTAGTVLIDGVDTRAIAHDRELRRRVRATVGLVFQDPDSQIVATVVQEDVAFGPENIGIPREEIRERVQAALAQVGMAEAALRPPHLLSAGQRQRVAIAGALAMRPRAIVFDEATAMLDPVGRHQLLALLDRLQEQGILVMQVTHHMEEAARARRVIMLDRGRIVADGPPQEVLTDPALVHALGLDLPVTVTIARRVAAKAPGFPTDCLTVPALAQAVIARARFNAAPHAECSPPTPSTAAADTERRDAAAAAAAEVEPTAKPVIAVTNLAHDYMVGTPLRQTALHDITMHVNRGEIVAIVGHTGSGKSTLIQHFNGLLRPQRGRVRAVGRDLSDPALDVKALRRQVGLVFQRPEDQLFERFVGDDVAFGPACYGVTGEELRERVRRAMDLVGLNFEQYKDRPIFALSSGQRRRVALAGVLALEPEVLVLDEPTAGLDPAGRAQLLRLLGDLRSTVGTTIVLVTHNLAEAVQLADRLCVMTNGRIAGVGTPRAVFADNVAPAAAGLIAPEPVQLMQALQVAGLPVATDRITPEEAAAAVVALLRSAAGDRGAEHDPGGPQTLLSRNGKVGGNV